MTIRLEEATRKVGVETHIFPTSLELKPGSLNVLLGHTLAGKTTLLRLLAGLDRPSSGKITVDGADVTGASVRQRNVAMVYQQFINYPSFTVFDNIASPLRRAGVSPAEINQRVRSVAKSLHIEGLLDRLPAELSGGQQQRVALARALVKEAGLLLLDEPLVNLDYKLREELRQELRAIFRRRESIVVYATTEPTEALLLGGHTFVVDKGRILQSGPSVEVFHAPASERVGRVFSDPPINLIGGRVTGRSALLGNTLSMNLPEHMSGLGEGEYRFGVRSNFLNVNRQSEQDVEIEGSVELAEISGSETFIHLAHHGVLWVAQEEGVHSFGLGETVRIYVDPNHVYAFDASGRLAACPPYNARHGS
jgi:glycerol transport system ATP-binding protein